MKKIDRFLNAKLNDKGLQNLFGGLAPVETCYLGETCDIHHDENDNGKVDPGECIEFVECK